jgi:hypothetical protein
MAQGKKRATGRSLALGDWLNLAKSTFCVNLVAAKPRQATKFVALGCGNGRRPGPRAAPTCGVTTVSLPIFGPRKPLD